MAAKKFWLEMSASKVDREAGIIHDVAVITHGPAKGHGMIVDDTTLSQVFAQMQSKRGLKTKLNHGYDVASVIGSMKAPKNDGMKITADLHLLKSSNKRDYVFELAEEMPDSVGMSIEFQGQDEELPNGVIAARCENLMAVALVDRPAANEGGMFCELTQPDKVDKEENIKPEDNDPMTPEQIAALNSATETIKALQAQNDELKGKIEGMKVPSKEELTALATDEVTKAFAAVAKAPVAAPAPAPATPAAPAPAEKKFEDHVEELVKSGMKNTDAQLSAASKHPQLYKEYREKVLGVVIANQ